MKVFIAYLGASIESLLTYMHHPTARAAQVVIPETRVYRWYLMVVHFKFKARCSAVVFFLTG